MLGSWRENPWPLVAALALLGSGALWLALRPRPKLLDWIFPVAVAPAICCGIAFVACGDRGAAYLAVLGAPLAWAAVLFERPVVLAALGAAMVTVFLALSARLGLATAAESTLALSPIAGMVAWVVLAMASRLREARRRLVVQAAAQRIARQELEESEDRHRSIVATVAEGLVVRRADGVIPLLNPAAERLLGIGARQMQGLEPFEPGWYTLREDGTVLPVEERPNRVALRTGQPVRDFTLGVHKPDGSITWLSVNSQPMLRDGEQVPYAVVAAYRDVTEQRRQREKLLAATRLASVGTLAAGVAHEINNPLAWLTSNLHYALEKVPAPAAEGAGAPELRQALEEAMDGAGRIASVVKAMRSLGRPAEADEPREIDVRAELQNAILMARNQLLQRARLEVQVPERLPPARARTNELGRVFLNLLVNAAQAVPEGRAQENRIRVTAREQSGEIVVEVSDSGVGIPPHLRQRIFDPFFTTKPVGVGTGLGLSIARSIVESAGGGIGFESQEGAGTTFRVHVPAQGAARPSEAPAGTGAALHSA